MFWLCCAPFAISSHSPQTGGSLLARIVPNPTGRNGYEDYLRAGDMVDPDQWNSYEFWIAQLRRRIANPEMEVASNEVLPEGVNPEMSELAVRKIANTRFGGLPDVVASGNAKQVWDPRQSVQFGTTYPELGRFKTLAKIASNRAHVEFSEGRSNRAVHDLLDEVVFSRRLAQATMISELVGVAVEAIALAEFDEHLSQLSYDDVVEIEKRTKALLSEPIQAGSVYHKELAAVLSSLDAVIQDPSIVMSDDENKTYGEALQSLSNEDKQKLKAMVSDTVRQRYAEQEQVLNGPEENWFKAASKQTATPSPTDMSYSNLALVLANGIAGAQTAVQYCHALAKGRIQLRLLYAHARILDYRWRNGTLPRKLADAMDAKAAYDPFAGQPLHYELQGKSYRLYSTAIPGIGPLELKYVARAAPHATDDSRP